MLHAASDDVLGQILLYYALHRHDFLELQTCRYVCRQWLASCDIIVSKLTQDLPSLLTTRTHVITTKGGITEEDLQFFSENISRFTYHVSSQLSCFECLLSNIPAYDVFEWNALQFRDHVEYDHENAIFMMIAADQNFCACVLRAFSLHLYHLGVTEYILQLLLFLSISESCQISFSTGQFILLARNCIAVYISCEPIILDMMTLLGNMTRENASFSNECIRSSLWLCLKNVLSRYQTHSEISWECISIIYHILSSSDYSFDFISILASSSVLDAVILCMNAMPQNLEIQEAGCLTLSTACLFGDVIICKLQKLSTRNTVARAIFQPNARDLTKYHGSLVLTKILHWTRSVDT